MLALFGIVVAVVLIIGTIGIVSKAWEETKAERATEKERWAEIARITAEYKRDV